MVSTEKMGTMYGLKKFWSLDSVFFTLAKDYGDFFICLYTSTLFPKKSEVAKIESVHIVFYLF